MRVKVVLDDALEDVLEEVPDDLLDGALGGFLSTSSVSLITLSGSEFSFSSLGSFRAAS